ncbi:VF530 family DNA-binding protein [Flavobacterium sp.]|uniref:VF530 family DNA-binding protein n=1 Tax=Flavobacterium sp. TaxID=239 RepID=UPI0040487272
MSNDPLHGKTLKTIVEQLVDFYGFDTLAELINIKCFKENQLGNKTMEESM